MIFVKLFYNITNHCTHNWQKKPKIKENCWFFKLVSQLCNKRSPAFQDKNDQAPKHFFWENMKRKSNLSLDFQQ